MSFPDFNRANICPQLQKELDINFRLSVSSSEEKPKKKTKKTTKVLLLLIKLINSVYLVGKDSICLHSSDNSCLPPQKTSRQNELTSPSVPKHKKMPFVAGTVRQFWCSAHQKTKQNTYYSLFPSFLIPSDCFFFISPTCHSQQAQATQSTLTYKVYSTWWNTISPNCANEWALCKNLDVEPRKASKRISLRLPPLLANLTESLKNRISRWARFLTCSWLCRTS